MDVARRGHAQNGSHISNSSVHASMSHIAERHQGGAPIAALFPRYHEHRISFFEHVLHDWALTRTWGGCCGDAQPHGLRPEHQSWYGRVGAGVGAVTPPQLLLALCHRPCVHMHVCGLCVHPFVFVCVGVCTPVSRAPNFPRVQVRPAFAGLTLLPRATCAVRAAPLTPFVASLAARRGVMTSPPVVMRAVAGTTSRVGKLVERLRLHNLSPQPGSRKKRTRVGRGHGGKVRDTVRRWLQGRARW